MKLKVSLCAQSCGCSSVSSYPINEVVRTDKPKTIFRNFLIFWSAAPMHSLNLKSKRHQSCLRYQPQRAAHFSMPLMGLLQSCLYTMSLQKEKHIIWLPLATWLHWKKTFDCSSYGCWFEYCTKRRNKLPQTESRKILVVGQFQEPFLFLED